MAENMECCLPSLAHKFLKISRRYDKQTVVYFLRMSCTLVLGLTAVAATADTLPEPEGKVLLIISGELGNTNHDDEAHFDKAMLESLPSVQIVTKTPWADGIQNFEGVRLSDLFEYVDAAPESIIAGGLDDYKFTITDLDYQTYPVIIAYQQNGSPISVRKLGPLRIMFPFDDYPELLTAKNTSSAVWQLVEMDLQ